MCQNCVEKNTNTKIVSECAKKCQNCIRMNQKVSKLCPNESKLCQNESKFAKMCQKNDLKWPKMYQKVTKTLKNVSKKL